MAYRALIERYDLSQETVAERIGKKRSTITNSLRLLKLPQEIRESLVAEEISSGHARAILAADGMSAMIRVWRQIVQKGLSVREAEKLTRKNDDASDKGKDSSKKEVKDAIVLKLESSLQQSLGTKVRIKHKKPGGTIEITYYSTDDLERILDIVESGANENR
jgi:ParB family chromosome partitioning protein